jgi:hypothetical protein
MIYMDADRVQHFGGIPFQTGPHCHPIIWSRLIFIYYFLNYFFNILK